MRATWRPTAPPEVAELLASDEFGDGVAELAAKSGRDPDGVRAEAAGYLKEMSASHQEVAGDAMAKFGNWMMRAYDVYVDDDRVAELRKLDRRHSLIFLFSHRSYLDGTVVPETARSRGISPPFTFAGANLNFFPLGPMVSRSGGIFIRRDTGEVPIYRWVLRTYIAALVRGRANLAWSIEGGRTRTGKLRPPAYGILRYVVDAVGEADDTDALVVPVSVVYDQLHEVALMTNEARGGRKRPEDLRWLLRFAREQRHRLGRAYMEFGEPFSLREKLGELGETNAVERIALDVCHRINRATPVTATSIVSLAMLGADRALSLGEVLATVRPVADYLTGRGWPVAGAADLTDRSTIRRALQDLVASGVLDCYEAGTETVWVMAQDQHLVAAFYRNTAIHVFVEKAIGELALLAASDADDPQAAADTYRAEALRLRDLLKFEFFFSGRDEFGDELEAEQRIAGAPPHLAHLVLRPYVDAYHVVADRLAAWEDEFDEQSFLAECLRVGRQWALQRRVASDESVTLELFRTALRLARHRGLVDGPGAAEPNLAKRRQDFAEEIAGTVRGTAVIAELARVGAA